jgi:hypothetical protein
VADGLLRGHRWWLHVGEHHIVELLCRHVRCKSRCGWVPRPKTALPNRARQTEPSGPEWRSAGVGRLGRGRYRHEGMAIEISVRG